MAITTGIVEKAAKGQYGFFVVLRERPGFYFNTKFEPNCKSGDEVKIEFEQKGDKRANVKRLKVTKAGAAPASTGGYGGATGDRQDSIVWQSAQERAVRLTEVLLTNGAVKLPAGEEARETIIMEKFDSLTYRLYEAGIDPRNSDVFKSAQGVASDMSDAPSDDGWGEEPSASNGESGGDWGDDW